MTNKELLNMYSCISISVNENLRHLLKENGVFLHNNIESLMKLFKENKAQNLIKIDIKENGMFYNYGELKKELSSFFNIPINDKFNKNVALLKEIIINNYSVLMPSRIANASNNYVSLKVREKFGKNKMPKKQSKRIKRQQEILELQQEARAMFRKRIYYSLCLFEDLILNENKYKEIPVEFDPIKLNLYIAHIVKNYALKYEENEDITGYDIAIQYLRDYLENNKKLLDTDFHIKDLDNCSIKAIDRFVKDSKFRIFRNSKPNSTSLLSTEINTFTDKPIKHYNYSFFEKRGESAKEFLDECLERSKNGKNPEELKLLLDRKLKLYESLGYESIRIGKDTFNGYFGFELPNHKIILDKLFEDIEFGIIAEDHAAYIVTKDNLEKNKKMSKSDAMYAIELGLIDAKRQIHKGNWEKLLTNKVYTK